MMIIIFYNFQKFFGIIRQVSGPNDHPTTPTFLQLYRMLSVYAVLKPNKTGNCTVFEGEKLNVLTKIIYFIL